MENKIPTIYSPEFIPFYPEIQKKYNLNDKETLLYGFIRFFISTSPEKEFYFSNDDLSKIFNISTTQISNHINNLAKKCPEIEITYKIKSDGGKIRFIKFRNKENFKSDFKKTLSPTLRKLEGNNNNINNNNIKKNINNNIKKNIYKYGEATDFKKKLEELKSILVEKKSTNNGINYDWQAEAFRIAKKLGIKLTEEYKARWLKLFKDAFSSNRRNLIYSAYSYLYDYPKKLKNEEKIKLFFWKFAHPSLKAL